MILVFSDLDGTLLDHKSYSFEPARPALDLLEAHGIPLILASSKTEAEMRPIARAIGIDNPMIVENGAGIVFPEADAVANDNGPDDYQSLRAMIKGLTSSLDGLFQGFGDWSVDEVCARTGLDPQAAMLAKKRRFSEPGLFTGNAEQKALFEAELDQKNFMAAQGGRFFTIMPKTSKAARMTEIVSLYADLYGPAITTIALGDAPNDLAMLETAHHGVIIANRAHKPLPVTQRERQGHILRSEKTGPEGWNEMIWQLVGAAN